MMKRLYLFIAFATCIGFTSCDKDDDKKPTDTTQNPDPEQIKQVTQKLTSHNWVLTGLTFGSPGSAGFLDEYNTIFPDCQKGDVYTFTPDNKIAIAAGQILCDSSGQQKTGTWALKNGVKSISISVPGLTPPALTGEFEIVELTNDMLKLKSIIFGEESIATYSAYAPSANKLLLTGKTWKISGYVSSYNGGPASDFYNDTFLSCKKDDVLKFESAFFREEEGATKCGQQAPQVIDQGSWDFTNSTQTKMRLISEFYGPKEFEILELNSTTFKYRHTYTDSFSGGTYVDIYTYTAL